MNANPALFLPVGIPALIAALLGPGAVRSSGAEPPPPAIVERGPHHRVWEASNIRALSNGRSITNRSSFTELETGLHYQNQQGAWVESKAEIELFQDGAVARQGQHQVIFAPNLNTVGAIDVLTPDGRRLRSHLLGLGLYDSATGNSTLIAALKDSVGELHPPNVVLYRDAFEGAAADVRYTYQKGGFVQDVIVLEKIALPQGFDQASTRLEVWTEFVNAPAPIKQEQARTGMTDESLDFGTMQIGAGRAFSLGQGDAPAVSAPVAKRWLQIDGRTFLVEAVQFKAVKDELNQLPAPRQQAAAGRPAGALQIARLDADHRPFPPARRARPKAGGEKIQMAGRPPPTRGLVLDYDLSGSLTNYVLQADRTYYVSGQVTLRGPTFEGGTVIKYANTNTAKIVIYDPGTYPVTWLASAYRPVVLTARDDHTVGEKIGTNALSGYYASTGLRFGSGGTLTLEHLRVSHAVVGVSADETILTNRHSQFVHCGDAIDSHWCNVILENVLIYGATNVFTGEMSVGTHQVTGRHVTVNQATNLANYYDVDMNFTNSLLVNVTISDLSLHTNAVVVTSSSGLFQTVGAGAHYLTTNSPYRNAGVTNLTTRLLADLKTLTTYPPVVVTPGALSNSLTLYPQAQRDTDQPDLGAHYQPIDYAFSHVYVNNATLTVQPGTVLGTYATNDNDYGIALFNNSTLVIEGTPANLARIVRHNTVQEQASTNWGARLAECVGSASSPQTVAPQVRFRFVDGSVLAQDSHHLRGYSENDFTGVFRDSQFHGGQFATEWPGLAVTNCLFERVSVAVNQENNTFDLAFHDNTFYGGALNLVQENGGTWTFKDNLFDRTAITNSGATLTHDYNAYVTNATRLGVAQTHDKTLTNAPVYLTSWLGRYYFPTNDGMLSTLLNAGSTIATNLGLYHFTTTTNQWKETNSTVDIGFHYVAANSSGQPIDTDSDGLPDYFEDTDGDGTVDSGETDWNSYNSFFGLSGTPGLQVFTPLK